MNANENSDTDSISVHSRLLPASSLLEWAIGELQATGIENPRFEAQLLLALARGITRAEVIAGLGPVPDLAQQEKLTHLVRERVRRVPLAYLRGTQEFYGLEFEVSPAVLIPRPETELLVDFAREKLGPNHSVSFADIGTGSGCIAVATLAHCPQARGLAIDLSWEALALAGRNTAHNGVAERLRFVHGSLLESLPAASLELILSNPPYIPTGEIETLQPEVRDFEPRLALDGGTDGLLFLRGLATGAMRVLRPGGWLAVEVAMGQAENVIDLLSNAEFQNTAARRDLAGIERLVCGQKT